MIMTTGSKDSTRVLRARRKIYIKLGYMQNVKKDDQMTNSLTQEPVRS